MRKTQGSYARCNIIEIQKVLQEFSEHTSFQLKKEEFAENIYSILFSQKIFGGCTARFFGGVILPVDTRGMQEARNSDREIRTISKNVTFLKHLRMRGGSYI